ncbi:MAG TPA: alanine racemase [Gemmatimonadales bacterium]|nr:alanine racemase [Gemmatimonadales bacterium]
MPEQTTAADAPAPARTWVEVDLGAVVANARTIAARARGSRLLPIVKADAYGLGAVPVARALEAVDPWGFAVATAHEGRELREAGITRPILVMGPQSHALDLVARHGLTPALGSVEQICAWLDLAPGRPFHVEVDTGMARWGLPWQAFGAEAARFRDAAGFEGVFTHFHSPAEAPASVAEQWRRFQSALATLERRPPLVHAANSAAILDFPGTAADLVRPGIFLYGGRAGAHEPRRVVEWRARVLATRWLEPGETVSYGATWRAPAGARTCIATIAAGYADGVPRALSNAGTALVEGRRLPFAGRVTMDFTMVAAPEAPAAGAIATLIGSDGAAAVELDEFAAAAGTISYEILTGLGRRVTRVYR